MFVIKNYSPRLLWMTAKQYICFILFFRKICHKYMPDIYANGKTLHKSILCGTLFIINLFNISYLKIKARWFKIYTFHGHLCLSVCLQFAYLHHPVSAFLCETVGLASYSTLSLAICFIQICNFHMPSTPATTFSNQARVYSLWKILSRI